MTKNQKMRQISRVFTPSAPVNSAEFFSGRSDEIMKVVSVLDEPGQHAVLYGERGVGKTSLANVLSELVTTTSKEDEFRFLAARINCTTNDTYTTIWRRVFRELDVEFPKDWLASAPDPDEMRFELAKVTPPKLIILDEFDRVEDDESLSLMADTIKSLSDHRVASKLVIVGVADSIDQLIGEHESVQRAMEEVHLARMNTEDSHRIIESGMNKLELRIDPQAEDRIIRLAEGLPHYIHWLCQKASSRAVSDDRDVIAVADVDAATAEAAQKHALVREYQTAIQSPRKNNLFSRVLASCALAEKNLLGQFTASAVSDPMSRIMGKRYNTSAFVGLLAKLTEIERGSVLRQEGVKRKYTYRFRNPLLQPFAIMAALTEGVIPDDYKEELFPE